MDSVYAIGEIKSTYFKSESQIERFSEVIESLKKDFDYQEIENTVFGGINKNSLMRDIYLASNNRVLNKLFAFIFFVNGEDFSITTKADYFINRDNKFLPNLCVFLDKGIVTSMTIKDQKLITNFYPDEINQENEEWCFFPIGDPHNSTASIEANHLGYLHYSLLKHLTNSFLEPPLLDKYLKQNFVTKKSGIVKTSDFI